MTPMPRHSQAVDLGLSAGESPARSETLSPYFTGLVIDGLPTLLEASYSLRYQVYCQERRFLPASHYPSQLEIDEFDKKSIHLGVVNTRGELVATTRMVRLGAAGLPLFKHCSLFLDEKALWEPTARVVEVSRLCVRRDYNRRAGDHFYSLAGSTRAASERRGGGEIMLAVLKTLYQATKRGGFTHWLAATEKSLQRLVAKYGFPFRAVGPEIDYYGLVSPYLMDLREFDDVIISGRIPVLAEFLDGLEPEHRPAPGSRRIEVVKHGSPTRR